MTTTIDKTKTLKILTVLAMAIMIIGAFTMPQTTLAAKKSIPETAKCVYAVNISDPVHVTVTCSRVKGCKKYLFSIDGHVYEGEGKLPRTKRLGLKSGTHTVKVKAKGKMMFYSKAYKFTVPKNNKNKNWEVTVKCKKK